MKIAVCFSGHVRELDKCYSNIVKYLLEPLRRLGTVDVFCSTWNTRGHRSDWDDRVDLSSLGHLNPTGVVVQKSNRDYYVSKYSVENYNHSFSGYETSGDSASI